MIEKRMEDADEPTAWMLETCRFWIQKVMVVIMVCVGVAGNTVTVMVLTRRRMRSSTNIYLAALAIADIIYLLFSLVLSFKHYSNIHDKKYEFYWRFYGLTHWLCDAASSTSVWLTVSFTIERYIAVCHPIKGKVLCTENRAKSIIAIVYIYCLLTTASTTFEYQLSLDESCIRKCNLDELNKLNTNNGNLNSSNTVVHHYIQNHNQNKNNNLAVVDHPNFNVYNDVFLKKQLNNILANCSSKHTHIIYVPVYPNMLNLNKHQMIIENQANQEKLDVPMTTPTIVSTNPTVTEDVLEKPPGVLEEVLNSSVVIPTNFSEVMDQNSTCCVKNYKIDTEPTSLGQNQTYNTIITWYSAVFFGLLPLVLIATFNCFLVRAVYLSQTRRRAMTTSQVCENSDRTRSENVGLSNENRITLMLIGVVVLFLICQTPTASWLIYYNFYPPQNNRSRNINLILSNVSNFLMTLNASSNFLLYCVLSKKFRSTFRKLFCKRGKKKQETILLSSTKNSQKFDPSRHGVRRNASEYQTPRNLETQSLTGIPRSKSLMTRSPGKLKSSDLIV